MKLDWTFPKRVLLALAVIAIVSSYPLIRLGTPGIIVAASVGALLMTLNVLAGFLAIEYSIEKSYSTFLKFVLGGMVIRMLVLAAALVILLAVFSIHVGAFLTSIGVFYILFLTLEIMYIQEKFTLHTTKK